MKGSETDIPSALRAEPIKDQGGSGWELNYLCVMRKLNRVTVDSSILRGKHQLARK